MSDLLRVTRAAQSRLGLPEGLQFWTMGDFAGGLNQQDARTVLRDSEAFWNENLLLVGRGRYRSLYDAGPALYTAPVGKIILWFFPFILDHTPHHFVVFTDGTAVDVNQDTTGVVTVSNTPDTFYQPGVVFPHGGGPGPPTAAQWGNRYLLVANNHTPNAYWAWDGTVLYGAGSLGPTVTLASGGHGYTSAPAVTAVGGTGSGFVGQARIMNGSVVGVDVINSGAGYSASDAAQLVFQGGGTDSGAILTAVVSSGQVTGVTVVNGGTGYGTAPSLTFAGGGGTGAAGTATVSGGVITSVAMTANGSNYTTPPAIVVQAGINRSAYGTIEVMPFGISGNTIETFDSRVWLAYPNEMAIETGGVINVSAPGSFSNFAQSAGGLLYTSTDRYLRSQYRLLRQSNGYLYPFGDSSVSIISNVQTSGTPLATSFNYQSTDPQVGIAWRDTGQDFSRTIIYANPTGVYGLYGGAVRRISARVNDVFDKAVFPPVAGALTPSAAVANLHTIRCYLILLTITDPFTFQPRNVLLGWDEANWFVASQTPALVYIATQEVNSALTAWGTDGTKLYPLFAQQSLVLQKRLVTKYFGAERDFTIKQPMAVYFRAQDQIGKGLQFAFTFEANGIMAQMNPPAGVYAEAPLASSVTFLDPQPNIPAGGTGAAITTYPVWAATAPNAPGSAVGLLVSSFSPDFELNSLTIAYEEITAVGY